MEFAVQIDGDDPDKARWVLAVDAVGERILTTNDERRLAWIPIASCRFAKAQTPDQPLMVMAVQPQPQVLVPNQPLRRVNGG